MSDLEGLLDDIKQNPDDDVPRLVAADWYEEHGDTVRAGYIRDSIALERLPEWDRSPLEQRRLDALVRIHEKRWLGEARGFGRVEWERGFPDSVTLTASRFLKQSDRVTQHFRAVSLTNLARAISDLAVCPALRRLRSLCLFNSRRSNASWAPLFRSPHLEGLRSLDIDSDLNVDSMEALRQAAFMPRLQRLRMDSITPSATDLQALSASHLRYFALSHAELDGERLEEYREIPGLAGLTHLHLTYSLDEISGPALARWTHLPNLRHLNLHFGTLHTVGAEALAGSTILSQLRELHIGFHEIGNRGVEALLQSPHLGQLESLDLCHSEATTLLGRTLGRWPGLNRLRELSLYYNGLRDSGLKTLLASRHLSALRALNIAHCDLEGDAGQLLGGAARLSELRKLTIWGNELGDRGATALIRSPHLQRLECLDATEATFPKRARTRLKAHFGDRYLSGE